MNLTMPLSTWIGTTGRPGEVAGLGPVDAETCRELADRLATGQGATRCLTLTDADGRAAGHACARNGPGPHGPPELPMLAAWLSSLKVQWLERGDCGHRRQGQAYRRSHRSAAGRGDRAAYARAAARGSGHSAQAARH